MTRGFLASGFGRSVLLLYVYRLLRKHMLHGFRRSLLGGCLALAALFQLVDAALLIRERRGGGRGLLATFALPIASAVSPAAAVFLAFAFGSAR